MIAHLSTTDMHYHALGAGRPILMLHGGFLDHHHMVAEMEPAFDAHPDWRRIYPDLPGHGLTKAPEGAVNYDDVLEVVLEFIDTVIGDQPFSVAGMSAGGHLARGLVAKCPERLLGVMLNAPAIEVDYAKRMLPDALTVYREPGIADKAGASFERMKRLASIQDSAMLDWLEQLFDPAKARYDARFADRSWEPEHCAFSVPLSPMARPFMAPSLILTGKQDRVTGYADAWPVARDYPRATFAVLDGAGHIAQPARPALFQALVVDWLARMEMALAP